MPQQIRVLVADPSASLQRVMVAISESEGDVEICSITDNGADAVSQFMETRPDVVIINVSLPVLDGPAAVKAIRDLDANVPILVFCTANVRGGEVTLKALAAGANDFIAKPSSTSTQAVTEFLVSQLVPAIRNWHRRTALRGIDHGTLKRLKSIVRNPRPRAKPAIAEAHVGFQAERTSVAAEASCELTPESATFPDVVVIGCSTGGPNALRDVLSALPPSFPVPILVVHHMPEKFTRYLAERLESQCPFQVREAVDGSLVTRGRILIAPGGRHMVTQSRGDHVTVRLNDDPPVNFCRPAVDVLLESVAAVYGAGTLAVILTGMGADGTRGCQKIKRAGGRVLVQDRDTSVVWGMPRSVEEAGLADAVVPLYKVAEQIQHIVRQSGKSAPSELAAASTH